MVKGQQTGNNERLVALEENMNHIKKDIADIKSSLNDFMKCADERYARKEEVNNLRERMDSNWQVARGWVQWTPTAVSVLIAGGVLIIEIMKVS